jgi:murein L,D-transpeptidase YafK
MLLSHDNSCSFIVKKISGAMLSLAAVALLLSCGDKKSTVVEKAFSNFSGKYVVLVVKKDFMLYVYERGSGVVKKYRIAYGLNPDGKPKLYSGDERTPEGAYSVSEMLSMDAGQSTESYKKLARMNRVFFRARHGHYKYGKRNEDLGDNAYGPRFFLLDYPGTHDRVRYEKALREGTIPVENGIPRPIGHGIAIHGNCDAESIGHLATSGCVRMYNDDIVALEQYIQLGTPVIILPE